MDVHNVLVVAHDKVNRLIRALLEPFKRRACSLNNIQIIHNIAAQLAQAHTGAVDAGFRVALHIAARTHAGQQTVNRAFVQAGFRRQAADAHAVAAAAQSFQQIECAVERLNGRLLRHENASLRSVL